MSRPSKITISYTDPDATESDSDSDVGDRNPQKKKEIVIWRNHPTAGMSSHEGDKPNPPSSKFPTGVRKRAWGKYGAEIRNPITKKRVWLGSYDSPEEASRAYQEKKHEFKQLLASSRAGAAPVLGNDGKSAPSTTRLEYQHENADLVEKPNDDADGDLEEFDMNTFRELMQSFYSDMQSEASKPPLPPPSQEPLADVNSELGAWKPSKRAKFGDTESIPQSPPLSPLLNFEECSGNNLQQLGFHEIPENNYPTGEDFSNDFESFLEAAYPEPEPEADENANQLADSMFVEDKQISD